MENNKQNTNINSGKNTPSLSSNPLNTPSTNTSPVERVPSATTKTSARPMRGQTSLQKQIKRAVPSNLEKTESNKKMRKDVDAGSNTFVACSPGSLESEVAKKACPTRGNKSSTTIDKSPTTPNMNGCSRQNDSEMMKSRDNAEEKNGAGFLEFIPNIESFKVIVHGDDIEQAIGGDIREKYFDLCLSQGSYLHARLAKIISSKHAVEIISVVTETSEWIRNSNLVSNFADFDERVNVLQGFELLGMNLGFLINKLNMIYGIVFESTMEVDLEKCKKAKTEHKRTEEKKNELDLKHLELEKEMVEVKKEMVEVEKEMVEVRKEKVEVEKKMVKLDYEIETIERIADMYDRKIRKEATGPW